jgi:dTDP-4-amino-4,6-dideoxygalactose transaminase
MIPLVDLQTQYQGICEEIQTAISRTLVSGQFVLGPEVATFEKEFAAYCGAAHGVGVNSGTSALHLALLAAGIRAGDDVITVPFTFVATVAAIRYVGANPIFVDIDPASYTMDVSRLEAALTDKTKAIIPVHLYGQPVDMDPLMAFARQHKLAVIEDAAQAHGARYKGRPVGSLGDYGCFSFYPGKNLGAYGEGGMIVTNEDAAADRLRLLRDWGAREKYHHDTLGFNYRMEGIQGAVLRVKLRYLNAWNQRRRDAAGLYSQLLEPETCAVPSIMPFAEHVFHLYVVRVKEREAMQRFLQAKGISTGIHYPIPVHLQKGYALAAYPPGAFPVAERAAREVLSLPLYPEITPGQVEMVARALSDFGHLRRMAA